MDKMNLAEILFMAFASCFDAMTVSISYRTSGIEFPLRSVAAMTLIHGLGMAFALFAADAVLPFSPEVCIRIGAVLIILIGLLGVIRPALSAADKKRDGALSQGSRLLALLMDETKADRDLSKSLSVKECIPLSLAVASDACAVGICVGPSLDSLGKLFTSGATLVVCFILVLFGRSIGAAIHSRLGGRSFLCYVQGGFLLALGLYMLIGK